MLFDLIVFCVGCAAGYALHNRAAAVAAKEEAAAKAHLSAIYEAVHTAVAEATSHL